MRQNKIESSDNMTQFNDNWSRCSRSDAPDGARMRRTVPILGAIVAAVVLMTHAAGDTQEQGEHSMQGWTSAGLRDELRPSFAYEEAGGPDGRPAWVIRMDEREGLRGCWTKSYPVVLALVTNPRTPQGVSTNFISRLANRDLKNLASSRDVPELIRRMARRTFVIRTKPQTRVYKKK